jgi:hypothetical protein
VFEPRANRVPDTVPDRWKPDFAPIGEHERRRHPFSLADADDVRRREAPAPPQIGDDQRIVGKHNAEGQSLDNPRDAEYRRAGDPDGHPVPPLQTVRHGRTGCKEQRRYDGNPYTNSARTEISTTSISTPSRAPQGGFSTNLRTT